MTPEQEVELLSKVSEIHQRQLEFTVPELKEHKSAIKEHDEILKGNGRRGLITMVAMLWEKVQIIDKILLATEGALIVYADSKINKEEQ